MEGRTHASQDVGYNIADVHGVASEVHGDPRHTLHEVGTSTPFTLDFMTLSDIGIVSYGHFDQSPYNRLDVDDSNETQPPEDNMGDEAGGAQDTHPDDPASRRVLAPIEVRTISKYIC